MKPETKQRSPVSTRTLDRFNTLPRFNSLHRFQHPYNTQGKRPNNNNDQQQQKQPTLKPHLQFMTCPKLYLVVFILSNADLIHPGAALGCAQ